MPDKKYPGIRWDAARKKWKVTLEVGPRSNRRTRATYFAKETPASEMIAWQEATRTALGAQLVEDDTIAVTRTPHDAVTLDDAAAMYEQTIGGMSSAGDRMSDLRAWLRAVVDTRRFGTTPVSELTDHGLRVVWDRWRIEGRAKSTLAHRRTALLQVVRQYAPTMEPIVLKALKHPGQHKAVAKELPYPTIRLIIAAIGPCPSKWFLNVMAETGLPPQTLRDLGPDDVDEDAFTMTLPARDKGEGADGVTLTLTPAGAEAFRAYRAAGWRPVCKETLLSVWRRACAAVRAAAYPRNTPLQNRGMLPATPTRVRTCTPYILRHSFALRFLDAHHGDVHALQQHMQHMSIETSMYYTKARASRAAHEGIKALARYQEMLLQ